MCDVKLAVISGKMEGISEIKIEELGTNSEIKKILGTYVGASMTLRRVTSLELIE
jgi:hypothetical protein